MRLLLTITAIISVFFALGFLLVPNVILPLYGTTTDANGYFVARLVGAGGVLFAVLAWLSRSLSEGDARRVVMPSLFASFLVQALVFVWGTLSGVFNALGWLLVLLTLAFALAFGYFAFGSSRPAQGSR